MAKTKTHSTAIVHRAPRAPQPITVRVAAPRAKKHGGRRGKGRMSSEKQLMGLILGGFALGFIDKSGTAIPTIPILGKAGTIAVAAHFFGKGKAGYVTDIRNAAASVAAYEFGKEGKVSGDEDDEPHRRPHGKHHAHGEV